MECSHDESEKSALQMQLQAARDGLIRKLEGLGEYDLRRPMTPTGTNLLGLVKHLAGVEYGYLGEVFERPAPESLSWVEDGTIWQGADMWATPDESSDYIIGLYHRACAHADQTIAELHLDATGEVSWWPEGKRALTLRRAILRMIGETAQHAGHADVVRELIDGTGGVDYASFGGEQEWRQYVARVQEAADRFRDLSAETG